MVGGGEWGVVWSLHRRVTAHGDRQREREKSSGEGTLRAGREGGNKKYFPPPISPDFIIRVVCEPSPSSRRVPKRRHGRGLTDRGGGEDEHERGIEKTKNKVEIHLFYFNIYII